MNQNEGIRDQGGQDLTTKWNTPTGMLGSRIQDFDNYVLVGRKGDKTTIFSDGDQHTAQNLLKSVAPELAFDQSRQPA